MPYHLPFCYQLVTVVLVGFLAPLTTGQPATVPDCPYNQYVDTATEVHTMCLPPNKTCVIRTSGVSAADQTRIVKLHNDIRQTVASGKQKVAGGVVLSSAANMRQLRWSKELADIAQAHTNQCGLNYECMDCRSTDEYLTGEIIYYMYNSYEPQYPNWNTAINSWYASSQSMTSMKANTNRPPTFTQMIWGLTKDIGCGFTRMKGNYQFKGSVYRYVDYYACIYGPAGNYPVDAYTAGPACSDCNFSDSTCCGSTCQAAGVTAEYTALCKATSPPAA